MYENRLATTPSPAEFINAGAIDTSSRLVDHEDGPVALQDTSQGLLYQVWTAKVIGYDIWLSAPNYPAQVLASGESISDVSIAFSQNAQLHYVWVDKEVTYLRWWDGAASQYTVTSYGDTMRTPKVTLDDHRPQQTGQSDVIFAYVKKSDNGLYFRQQRDRFLTEHLLDAGPFISIERMYFNTGNALQFLLTRGDPNV